jgi:hypothetical protein
MQPIVRFPRRGTATALSLALAVASTLFAAQAPAQEPVPSQAPPIKELRFQDFLRKPMGVKGVELSEALQQANGQEVRIVGYMVQQEVASPGRFLLTPQPVQMSQHADGEADDLPANAVLVVLDPSQQDWSVAHARGLIAVQGRLRVGRQEATDGRVSWIRLHLAPDALRSMNSFELAGYLHSQQHRH